MTNLSSKIIERIEKEHVTPRPRWHFMLVHGVLALAFFASILLGSIGVAIVIRHYALTDWEMARQFAGSHLRTFFLILPYLWLIVIGLMILLSEFLLKHSKKGYRVSSWKFVALSVGLSVFFGGICYFSEADRPVEEGLRRNLSSYAQLKEREMGMFVAPERGVLAGKIIAINSDNEWVILDLRNAEWLVDVHNAVMRGQFRARPGIPVGMIGQVIDNDQFRAERITVFRKFLLPAPPPPPIILIQPQ